MTPYGKVYNKSTVTSDKNYSRVEGIGYVKSDDVKTVRSLASGLPDCVSHGNKIAYDLHVRFAEERRR